MLRLSLLIVFLMVSASAHANCPALLEQQFSPLKGGEKISLCQYHGKVLLVVNTASYCGNTPQYKGLQALHQKYAGRGLAVIGFPSNDFGRQEPGTATEIAEFCERTYQVSFPMFEKSSVRAANGNPFYDQLAVATGERPRWNFHKFLIDRGGKTVVSISSSTLPDDAEFVKKIEALLAAE
jgi:glutathione peroxidase